MQQVINCDKDNLALNTLNEWDLCSWLNHKPVGFLSCY